MSLLIQGMCLPAYGGYNARIVVNESGIAKIIILGRSVKTYDLVEVPAPHGDLIDKSVLLQDLFDGEIELARNGYTPKYSEAFDEVELAIPVIKAEGK